MQGQPKRGEVNRAEEPPAPLTPSNCPLPFLKRKVQVDRYRSVWKLDQNVKSIEGESLYFGFYLHLKFRTKVGIIV